LMHLHSERAQKSGDLFFKMAVPSSSNDGTSSAETATEIKSLLQQLRKSSRHRKKRGGSASADRDDALRLDKLRKTFGRLIEQGEFDLNSGRSRSSNSGDGNNGARSQWKTWLTTQHETYMAHLIEAVVDGKTTALRTYCGVLASSPVDIIGLSSNNQKEGANNNGMVSERLLNKLIEACVKSRRCLDMNAAKNTDSIKNKNNKNNPSQDEGINAQLMMEESMLTLLESEFIRPHRDVQYFICKGVRQIAFDLLQGLDQVRKRAGVSNGSDNKEVDHDAIAEAEANVGSVAENMCRLLMTMDYVPKNQTDLTDVTTFLYPPPILSGNDDASDDNSDDGAAEEEESEEEEEFSDDASESSEDEEESTTASKKRKNHSPGTGSSKRTKKTKLIAWQQSYKHRNAHQEAWLSVLRLPNLPSRTQKRILQHLSTYVLKICPSPLRFAEYFTRSFQGGNNAVAGTTLTTNNSLTAILSLHGLFILMLDHQLEYPQFYNSLYTLLHPRILYTKHRSRFLRLLSQALLSNSMLPAYVVGSYCKKLCRLALNGPPSGSLFVLALVSNLLRKHGECACLIHRRGVIAEDVFVEEVDDLIKTRALESSLWELVALEKHYHPAISTLAKSVGTEDDKTTPMHDMEDFMAHTYKSLFEQEKKRLGSSGGGKGGVDKNHSGGGNKKKGGGGRVSLTFVEPTSLFTKDDVFGDFFQCS